MNPKLLQCRQLYTLMDAFDKDLAEETHKGGCPCGGALHSAVYPRKPRGGLKDLGWDSRQSFCCEREGCRKRRTPPSVRFLGGRVYLGVMVVLVAAMMHGANSRRIAILSRELGIDRRTLERWRQWWLETFVETPFWKAAGGRFMPPVDTGILPLSLVECFKATTCKKLLNLMGFLTPLTTSWMEAEMAF